ncbi:hypothetical protein HYW46_03760 [Candidatus Daviesbacteria bacterium]|nr:hypothetical protein [Candidatus Daviesbacteria bacterium]
MKEYLPIDFCLEFNLERNGLIWKFLGLPLANDTGFTSHMINYVNCYVDWHDVYKNPREARMHMYLDGLHPLGLEKPNFEEKLFRMRRWADAILAFDSIMTDDYNPKIDVNELKKMLSNSTLPRPSILIHPTGKESLIKLFSNLDCFYNPYDRHLNTAPIKHNWNGFVDNVKSGKFIEEWKRQKGR